MSMNDDRFDLLLWEMAHKEETPLPPGLDGRLEAIYARLEQEDRPQAKKEEKPVKRKLITPARAAVFAAVVALMAVSMTVGALAFSTETIVEVEVPVPVEQETIVIEDFGITLILPDSWKDKYVAVMSDDAWYRCRVYAKSTYDWCMAHEDFNDGSVPYMGFLFSVAQWYDEPITPEEFYSGMPTPAIYLMATEEGTYCLGRPSDQQCFSPEDYLGFGVLTKEEAEACYEDWTMMNEGVKDIQVVLNGVMEGALNRTGYEE